MNKYKRLVKGFDDNNRVLERIEKILGDSDINSETYDIMIAYDMFIDEYNKLVYKHNDD